MTLYCNFKLLLVCFLNTSKNKVKFAYDFVYKFFYNLKYYYYLRYAEDFICMLEIQKFGD